MAGSRRFGEALERIQRDFEGVCPLEEIDRFAHLLARALGRPGQPAPSFNRATVAAEQRRVGPRTTSRFYERNADDLRLYWWVVENWRDHWRFGGRVGPGDAPGTPA